MESKVKDVELERPESWPDDVRRLIDENRDILISYQNERQRIDRLGWDDIQVRIHPPTNQYRLEYERLVACIERLLCGNRLVGYHCTRLLPAEIDSIRKGGLRTLSTDLVTERLCALVDSGKMHPEQRRFILESTILRSHLANQHGNRTGMLWLCPNRSALRDANGVHRLFRSWGGEALYAGFEDEPYIANVLTTIGQPAIVKCAIPLPINALYGCRAPNFISNAVCPPIAYPEPSTNFDLSVSRDLKPSEVTDVILFGDPRFEDLTSHQSWEPKYRLE